MDGIPYQQPQEHVRTTVDDAHFHIAGDPNTDGWDHHWMYHRVDPKTGKVLFDRPLQHDAPYPTSA